MTTSSAIRLSKIVRQTQSNTSNSAFPRRAASNNDTALFWTTTRRGSNAYCSSNSLLTRSFFSSTSSLKSSLLTRDVNQYRTFFVKSNQLVPASHLLIPYDGFRAGSRSFSSSLSSSSEKNPRREFKTSTTAAAAADDTSKPVPDFSNYQAAYEAKSSLELVRAAMCFRLCRIPFLVNNAEVLLNMSNSFFGQWFTSRIMKSTMYGHFCAGEDEQRIRPVVQQLDKAGIGSILDYAAESDGQPSSLASMVKGKQLPQDVLNKVREYEYESEAQCDAHVQNFQKCIRDVATLGNKDGYAAVKVTALGNPKLLARMSQAIIEAKKLFQKFDMDHDGFVSRDEFEKCYNVFFNDDDNAGNVKQVFEELDPNGTGMVDYISWSMMLKPKDLPRITSSCKEVGPLALATPTEEEIELIEAMYERGHTLAKEATQANCRLLVDAEQVRYQPAIDCLVLDLQQTYNAVDTTDKPIIYNTYQCYLKDATERLHTDVERSERFNFHFGAKLVRGAYMESERMLATTLGAPSPIWDKIEETHDCYNNAIAFLLEQSAKSKNNNKRVELMCATHNQTSIEKAIESMERYNIDKKASTICFAQLYGMSDHLTYNLGKYGYRAYKYVPYGQVQEVMPYLLRRARENSAIVGGATSELGMIRNELKRRWRSLLPSSSSSAKSQESHSKATTQQLAHH